METKLTPDAETITSADVESTADTPAALTANLFFCSLCQSVYRQAKILPCLHSFCRPCLVGLVTHGPGGSFIHCPSCQFRAPLPPSGVVGVPDNSFLNRLCQDYVRDIKDKMGEDQQQHSALSAPTQQSPLSRPSPRASREGRVSSSRRGQNEPTGHGRETLSPRVDNDDDEDEEEEEEESKGPQDPFASERAAPSESGDSGVTLEAIHNRNRLQAKVMGLQGEALRLTYAIDQINSWPEEWQQKREDLKRAVRAHSSQLQFIVKRAERALLAKIEEAGREADHRFMRAAEVGKQRLRDSLKNVLHEVNVLKGVRELGMDAEVNTMCAFLLGRSVGMGEVALDMPAVALEGLGQKESDIQHMVTESFGNLVFSERPTDVFKPEPIDFSDVPVEEFVNKTAVGEQSSNVITLEVSTATSADAGGTEESTGERKSRKRSTADKRRHKTDLGLDSPDVREYLAQFQTARETFRARRREILQQGQLGRVAAASPARGLESGEWGLDAVRARLRSSSRDAGRIHSVDRGHPQIVPTGVSVSEIPSLMRRRGSAPVARSSSMSRLTSGGQASGAPSAIASKYLSTGVVGKPPPSPVTEEPGASHDKVVKDQGATSDADFYHSLLSPQSQRRHISRERRHSLDAVPVLENMSIPAAAELLTQTETSDGGSSRPIRRAIISAADKRAKIEILRESWQRRKEILIQNEGFVTVESSGSPRQGSESTDSPRRIHSPPASPKSEQDKGVQEIHGVKQSGRRVLLTENRPNVQQKDDVQDSTERFDSTKSLDAAKLLKSGVPLSSGISAATDSSLYSSGGGPAVHLVNTVKITIPEVSERTSPTPDMKKTITFDQAKESDKETAHTEVIKTSKIESQKPSKTEALQLNMTEILQPTKTEVLQPSKSSTKIIYEETSTPQVSALVSTTTPIGREKQEELEETAENEKTETLTVTIPISSSQTSASSISMAKTATTTAPITVTQEAPRPTTSAAPTYFFKSRLTGLPVGGSGASHTAPTAPPKPTHFFTSRLTGLPVGAPVTTLAEPTSSTPITSTVSKTPNIHKTTLAKTNVDTIGEASKSPLIDSKSPNSTVVVTSSVKPVISATMSTVPITDASPLALQMSPVVTLPKTAATITANAPEDSTEPKASFVFNSKYTSSTDFVTGIKGNSNIACGIVNTAEAQIPTEVFTSKATLDANSAEMDQNPAIVTNSTTASTLSSSSYTVGFPITRSKDVSTSNTAETIKSSTMPFFKSKLTGVPVGGSSLSSNVSVSASVPTTTPASMAPFFKSRLTGEPVGRATSNTTITQDIGAIRAPIAKPESSVGTTFGTAESTTTTRYPSRYNVESRYKPRETVDVASLIAAMYKGNEKNIIDTQAPDGSTLQEKRNASEGDSQVAGEIITTTTSSAIVSEDTANESQVKRELPSLRSAPAFSYVRRYNLSSSSSPSQHSTATLSENVPSGNIPKAARDESRFAFTQSDDTSKSTSKFSAFTTQSSSEGQYSSNAETTEVYEQTPRAYTHDSSRYSRHIPTGSGGEVENFRDLQKTSDQSTINRGLLSRFNTTACSETTSLSQKLDYPRAHLPDVIPETTLQLAGSDEALSRVPASTQGDILERKTTIEIHDTAPVEFAKAGQDVKKSFGFDMDSEISRGISITDAIRRSGSPIMPHRSPATVRRSGVPEPLDLQVGAVATSPTGAGETKEASSPSTKSPIPSPSSPNPGERGIKGRLKEIARKKKERWRHLTIN